MTTELVFRVPCTFPHGRNCDETQCLVLHRSVKEGDPKPNEKFCELCEGIIAQAQKQLRETGTWKCPACGLVHSFNRETKELTPMFSIWRNGLSIQKKEG